MAKIILYNGTLKLFFGGEYFHELKEVCKDNGLKFTTEDGFKFHTGKPSAFWSAIPEFESIEEVTYKPSREEVLKFCEPKVGVKFFRARVNDALLKFKPKKGKAGEHENYQYEAIHRGISQSSLILSLPLGSGKSYIITNILNHLEYYKKADKFLIIVPLHLRWTIQYEIIKFFYHDNLTDEDFYLVDTKNRKPFDANTKFIICSYQNLTMISDDAYFETKKKKSKSYRINYLPLETWGTSRVLVCDEVHLAKNMQSRTAKTLHMIKDKFNYKYLMSGTLCPNNASELYSPLTLLDDNIITKSFSSWIKTIANVGNRFSDYAINYFYDDKVKKFTESMRPYIMSLPEDILELPGYVNEKLYADLSPKQLEIYKELVSHTLNVIKEEKGEITTKELVNKFSYMSLALDNPSIIRGKIDKYKNPRLHSLLEKWNFKKDFSKLEIITELLSQYIKDEKRKVILWCYHPITIEELKDVYSEYNPLVVHGAVKTKDLAQYKEDTIDLFKKRKDHNLLIGNPSTMDSGLTITKCDRMIYVDRNFNYRVYSQSSKRTYRIGQENQVICNNLIYSNSLDERVDIALEGKDDINRNLLKTERLTQKQMKDVILGKMI